MAFLAVVLRAVVFFAGAFFAVVFLAGAVLAATAFLAAVVFFAAAGVAFFAAAVVFFAAADVFFAVVFLAVAVVFFSRRHGLLGGGGLLRHGLLGGGLLGGGLGRRTGGRTAREAALGGLLHGHVVLGELLRAAHQVLEALSRTEAGHRGLLDPYALTRLRVAGVTGGAVDLLERAEAGDRNPVTCDNRTNDRVEHRIDGVRGLLTAADLVGNRFYELRLVHVFPFGDIARTKLFRLFRTLGRYIPQIKHETG